VYVKDCCSVVRSMLAAKTLSGLFNVGTGSARSFADLARAVFHAVDREPRIEYIDMPEALHGRYQYFTEADTRKLCASGLAPSFHSLEAGVSDYVLTHLVHEHHSTPVARPQPSSVAKIKCSSSDAHLAQVVDCLAVDSDPSPTSSRSGADSPISG
jgi:hypothetical protein